jgi:putative heme transporter
VGIVVLVRRRAATVLEGAERGLARTNRVLRRAPDSGRAALRRFGDEVPAIRPRRRDWILGLGQAELTWVADLAVLIAAANAVDVDHPDLSIVTLAYVAGIGSANISPLPGGFGSADTAMILLLTSSGVPTVSATAAVLVFCLVSVVLVVAMGWRTWAASRVAGRRQVWWNGVETASAA